MAKDPELIKVCLTNKGEDTETPWAQDLGPAPGAGGSRKVKLVNVPFMHAKPTWGDVIVVSPVREGFPTWDRGGLPWKQIGSRIVEDGGRWAMIVDYHPHDGTDPDQAFSALRGACDGVHLVCEGAWGPHDGDPGRVYLAVPKDLVAETVMQRLTEAELPVQLIQVHPEPKPQRARAQTVVGVTPADPRRPARAVTEKPIDKTAATAAKPAKAAPAKPASAKPAKAAPAKPASAKAAPAKAAPAKPAPAKPASAKPAKPASAKPAKAAPAKATPAKKAAPRKPAPAKKSPAKQATAGKPTKPARKR